MLGDSFHQSHIRVKIRYIIKFYFERENVTVHFQWLTHCPVSVVSAICSSLTSTQSHSEKQRKEEHLVAIWFITTNYLSYSLINNKSYQPPNADGYSIPLIVQYFIEDRYLKLRMLPFNCSPHCCCIRVVPAVCSATSRPVPSLFTIADQSRPVPVRCTLHKFKICHSYDKVLTYFYNYVDHVPLASPE